MSAPRLLAAPDALRLDADLVRDLATADETAFAAIYDRYWDELHAHATRKLGCPHEAEEVVQDLFVALWHKRGTVVIGQLRAYLFGALRYRIIDCIRAQAVRRLPAARPAVADDRGTEETLALSDLTAALAAGVRRLPGHAREVFQLSRFEHRTVPEIAAHLHVSPKTVEYHLARALKSLSGCLREFLSTLLLLALLPAS